MCGYVKEANLCKIQPMCVLISEMGLSFLSHVYTCEFYSLLRLFCEKMTVAPNWKGSRNRIATAQKGAKKRK